MTNMEKYVGAFVEVFEMEQDKVQELVYGKAEQWDSVVHMGLVATLEDAFEIEMEPEDILAITSFEKGIEVLGNKGIVIA